MKKILLAVGLASLLLVGCEGIAGPGADYEALETELVGLRGDFEALRGEFDAFYDEWGVFQDDWGLYREEIGLGD